MLNEKNSTVEKQGKPLTNETQQAVCRQVFNLFYCFRRLLCFVYHRKRAKHKRASQNKRNEIFTNKIYCMPYRYDQDLDHLAKCQAGIERLAELNSDPVQRTALQAKAARVSAAVESRAKTLVEAENKRNSRLSSHVKENVDEYLKEARHGAAAFWGTGAEKITDESRVERLTNHFVKWYMATLPKEKPASLLDAI